MKSSGEMTPRVGCCQRSSASTPRICTLSRSKIGLVEEEELLLGHGRLEVGLQLEPVDGGRLHGGLEQDATGSGPPALAR